MAGKGGKGGGGGGQGRTLNVQLSRMVAQRLSNALTGALGSPGATSTPVSVPLSREDWQDILIAVANVSPFPRPKGKGKGKGKGII